jgi:hypothetical protein
MAGPNSAPNGDARLVKGHLLAEFVWVEYYDELTRMSFRMQVPLRDYLARKHRLLTGKTQ